MDTDNALRANDPRTTQRVSPDPPESSASLTSGVWTSPMAGPQGDPPKALCYSDDRSRSPGPDGAPVSEDGPASPATRGPVSPARGEPLPQTVRMSEPTFFEKHVGQSLNDFVQLPADQRATAIRAAIPDLNFFFDQGSSLDGRDAPERTRALARSLYWVLAAEPTAEGGRSATAEQAALRERIITDAFLRSEADRDQNVYLGKLFTRTLTHAVPDLIFQPVSATEAARAFRWAREHHVPVTLRGAASTAMGGSVPNDAGLTLDLSRLDAIEIDAGDRVCVIGAGARLRTVHQRLAERGLALKSYPSNLGGTLAGWFATGGIGMNAFGRGRAVDSVCAADLLLPSGELLRFQRDGRLEVPDEGSKRKVLGGSEMLGWFRARGYEPFGLPDLAGSEGAFGLILNLTVRVEPRPEIGAFLLSFEGARDALRAADWVVREALRFGVPANLKYLSASHLHHVRRVWRDEDSRDWRRSLSALSAPTTLPWARIAGPGDLGATRGVDRETAAAYLFVDFLDLEDARRFAATLRECPGSPIVLGDESARFAAERFKPQQTKRLGPGLIAAEVLMPVEELERFLPRAESLARHAGSELDAEIYFLPDGQALVIAGYLTDHRNGDFALDLVLAPALTDLAMSRHSGRPYVLGRWQSPYLSRTVGAEKSRRIRKIKTALDPGAILNRGVLVGPRFHGPLGALLALTFVPGVSLVRAVYASPLLAWLVWLVRRLLRSFPGPAHGRGQPATVGASFRASPPDEVSRSQAAAIEAHRNGAGPAAQAASQTPADRETSPADDLSKADHDGSGDGASGQTAEDRALHCVNCGECNSVCPIFHQSKIRLPQMLTHLGESIRGGESLPLSGSVLLDLCMRCGNCEEVCQAGIPHLPLYQRMQEASDRLRAPDRERHAAIVAAVHGSPSYTGDFLDLRPGGYIKRSPASLPGVPRFLVLRSENDAGPAATCIHCGGCVSVCPTHANREFEGADPRWITTLQERCIGCGACVEVCPANLLNGGQTLRVMEAPTRDWFSALEEFELREKT